MVRFCSKPIDDIDRVIEAARPSGNTIRYIRIDKSTWNKFKVNQQVREQYAFYRKILLEIMFLPKRTETHKTNKLFLRNGRKEHKTPETKML
jgi:hypothetical protein